MDIYSFLGREFACPYCQRTHRIPVKKIVTSENAFSRLPGFINGLVRKKNLRACLLADEITWEVAGRKCIEVLQAEFPVSALVFKPIGEKTVSAREEYIPQVTESAGDKDVLITTGAGTITDLGKYAGEKLKIPVISFPTAPSMNAYTSGVASLIAGGLKTVVPVQPALGVLTDTGTICRAPVDLIRAGFADSLAKSAANADWMISHFLTGEDYCCLPGRIVDSVQKKYLSQGAEIKKQKPDTIQAVMEGLNLAGISMVIAGKSSPASGGEHLISHFLDMFSHQNQREIFAYHGLQVGIGIVTSSRLYDTLKTLSEPQVAKRLAGVKIDYDRRVNALTSIFPNAGDSIRAEFSRKKPLLEQLRANLADTWERINKEVFPTVYPEAQVRKSLGAAGCPVDYSDVGVPPEISRNAVTLARYLRGRITILDIADELGLLEEIIE